jgi:hypothetical protein
MSDRRAVAAIPLFHAAIAALRSATLRGMVMPADRELLAQVHARIQGVPGVAAPPGERASPREALDWLVVAFAAYRADQERRRTATVPISA